MFKIIKINFIIMYLKKLNLTKEFIERASTRHIFSNINNNNINKENNLYILKFVDLL